MDILFSSRAGIYTSGKIGFCRATWPLGSIRLDAESLTLGVFFTSYRLNFGDIDCIRFGWVDNAIIHHASNVPSTILISGFNLARRLREAIQQHQLPVRMEG
jgi:hypothetical protein